jgi:hypothetical protein
LVIVLPKGIIKINLEKKLFLRYKKGLRSQKVNRKDIEAILRDLGVENFTINRDETVDVNGTVDISFRDLKEIPVQFGKVMGDFNCSNNGLSTLLGCPDVVGVSFFCHKNCLTSLEGAPYSVGKAFICSSNMLETLRGAPPSVNGSFSCSENRLKSLEGAPETVMGNFDCTNNLLTTLEGIPKYVKNVLYCSGNNLPNDLALHFKRISSFLIINDDE